MAMIIHICPPHHGPPVAKLFMTGSAKTTKTETYLIAQDYSCTPEVSMHSVSTAQCEWVCFSGGHFADPVMSQLKNGVYIEGTDWLAMSWNCCHC